MTAPTGSFLPEVRETPAGNGLRWWTDSFSWLFADLSRLGVWIGMLLCCFLILIALHWLPFLGSVASHLLMFVFSGGLMMAARDTQRGQVPQFRDLFAGFGPQGGALVGAGLLILLASLAVLGLMLLIGLGTLFSSLSAATSYEQVATEGYWLRGVGLGSLLLLLICLLLFVPISMAAWLAPALIMLRGAGPVDALRWSLIACGRNLGSLTVYGLVGIVLALLATLMFMIGWLFLLPLTFLSSYAAFRDIFAGDIEAQNLSVQPSS
ncbi:MAG TPA: BPSS1780 family membrane protein [Burkholderiaceae bacterium]|nr:BPSS1780 family membrane protein [Burkholderiaceae bacterium]